MSMTGELIKVEDQLDEYFSALQEAENEEQRTQVQLAMTSAIQEHASRVDQIAAWMKRADAEMEFLKKDEEETRAKRKAWETKKETVRAILAQHMETTEQKKLRGNKHAINLMAGRFSLDILDEHAVPLKYRSITVTLPALAWSELLDLARDCSTTMQTATELMHAAKTAKTTVDTKTVWAALDNFEDVPGAAITQGAAFVAVK